MKMLLKIIDHFYIIELKLVIFIFFKNYQL